MRLGWGARANANANADAESIVVDGARKATGGRARNRVLMTMSGREAVTRETGPPPASGSWKPR